MSESSKLVKRVVRLYCDSGVSTHRIARQLGIDRRRVTGILRGQGIEVAARGVGRRRPLRVRGAITESTLSYLYVNLQLSSVEIGRALGLSDRFIRSRLRLWGINTRSRGQWNRFDRTDIETDDLVRLYLEKGWTAATTGEELGVSGGIVLRSAHALGLPVREGGPVRSANVNHIRLIEALYEDPMVMEALTRYGVPIVREPGLLWVRFPEMHILTPDLLTVLYAQCGLSCFQIELLTGVPISTILRRMEEFEIERRHRGGRSPLLTRWRTRQVATPTHSSVSPR